MLVLMSNMCYLTVIFLVVTARYLVVTAHYTIVTARYRWLLLVTARHWSFPLLVCTKKIIVSMEKFMLRRKMLNIIVFCKAQHNAYHIIKKSPSLSLYMLINVMLIKKTCISEGLFRPLQCTLCYNVILFLYKFI